MKKKKPSEKNKAWEKERRDRLNKSFDNLAKLLPSYDPSVVWTKIDIIQKSILYIQTLQQRNSKYLASKDPEGLKQCNELMDALKYLQMRNGQLSGILKEAKINVPAFNLPKYLREHSKLILDKENLSEKNDVKTVELENKKIEDKITNNVDIKKKVNAQKKTKQKKELKLKPNDDEEIPKITKTVTVTSTVKPDVLKVEENVATTSVLLPITIVPAFQTPQILPQTCISTNTIQFPQTNLPNPLPSLIKIENLPPNRKLKKLNSNHKFARDQNGKVKILPQPHLKFYYRRADGKIPIPLLRKKIIVQKKKRKPRKRKIVDNNENCGGKNAKLIEENLIVEINSSLKNSETKIENNIASDKQEDLNLYSNLRTVSPTAAFLHSFPVVSSTTNSGKISEKIVNPSEIDNITKNDEIDKKDPNAENLENLDNFFATKEYSKYCAEKNELITLENKSNISTTSIANKTPVTVKPKVKILQNIKVETKKLIKTVNSNVNTKSLTNSNSIAITTFSNIPITNSTVTINSDLTSSKIVSPSNVAPLISNSITLPIVSYQSNPNIYSNTLGSNQYTPNSINFNTSMSCPTSFLSNLSPISSSICKTVTKPNTSKFNLSTQGPICTPLPLGTTSFMSQYNSLPKSTHNFEGSTNLPMTLPEHITLSTFNQSNSAINSAIKSPISSTAVSNLIVHSTAVQQNISKPLINSSQFSSHSQNHKIDSVKPLTAVQSNETNPPNIQPLNKLSKNNTSIKYQASFENFNLKNYAATKSNATTTTESFMKSTEITSKNVPFAEVKSIPTFSPDINSKSAIISHANLIPLPTISSTGMSVSNSNINVSHSQNNLYPLAVVSSSFAPTSTIPIPTMSNINSMAFSPYTSTLIPNVSQENSTPNLSTEIKSIRSIDSYFVPPSTLPFNSQTIATSSTNFIPYTITNTTMTAPKFNYSNYSNTFSNPTHTKTQSSRFYPYDANFKIPTTTTNLFATFPSSNHNSIASVPVVSTPNITQPLNKPTIANTPSNCSLESISTKNPNSKQKLIENKTNQTPVTSNSLITTTVSTSQLLLRPYDLLNSVGSVKEPSINFLPTTTTAPPLPPPPPPSITNSQTLINSKETYLTSNYSYQTCTTTNNYSHPTITNTTHNNINNYSAPTNTVYSTAPKNYYYPLPTESSSTFSFSLTTSADTQKSILANSQPLMTYSRLKTKMPWIPPAPPPVSTLSITSSYNTSFTFSLTPTTAVSTTVKSLTPSASSSSSSSSSCLLNSTQSTNSYNSATNFTFSLTTPKTTLPLQSDETTSKINLNSKTQYKTQYSHPNYHPVYNCFEPKLNFNNIQKDTTNFTFALTKPTTATATTTTAQTKQIETGNLFAIDTNLENLKNINAIDNQTTNEQFKIPNHKNKIAQKLTKIPGDNSGQGFYDCELNKTCSKIEQKSHVNWMTSTENLSIPVTKSLGQYFPSQVNENFLSWSPNKMYDPSSIQQTPMTSFYGDSNNFTEFPNNNSNITNSRNLKNYNTFNSDKFKMNPAPLIPMAPACSSNNNNFFSVSQMVDQNPSSSTNFGINQNYNNQQQTQQYQQKKIPSTKNRNENKDNKIQINNFPLNYLEEQRQQQQQQQQQKPTTISNNYSAEALISKKEKHRQYNPSSCANNDINNPTDIYNTIDQMEPTSSQTQPQSLPQPQQQQQQPPPQPPPPPPTIIDQNSYHSNNYFYNYHHHHHPSSISNQNYGIQNSTEMDYLSSNTTSNAYNNSDDQHGKITLNKIDKKLQSPITYPTSNPSVASSTIPNPNSSTNLISSYDPNYGHHTQYCHGTSTVNNNYPISTNNWTKKSTCSIVAPISQQYQHNQQHIITTNNQEQHLQQQQQQQLHHHQHHQQQHQQHQQQQQQQNNINSQSSVTGNLTNFNLSSICPEINDKVGPPTIGQW